MHTSGPHPHAIRAGGWPVGVCRLHAAQGAAAAAGAAMSFAGILLAAGRGSRFRAAAADPTVDKLLARLPDGRPVAVASAMALRAAVGPVIAVVKPADTLLADMLREAGCTVVTSPRTADGMGASLAVGARGVLAEAGGLASLRGCAVALGDMPWLLPATIRAVCAQADAATIAVPVHQGRRGHPVVFPAALLPALTRLDGDRGARDLLRVYPTRELECDDPGTLRDVDQPADLQ